MDYNNWRPSIPNGDTGDWRNQLPPDSRQKIVNKIMETLSRGLPYAGPEEINELWIMAARFEEKIFSAAVNQTDYLRNISMNMLTMETQSQNAAGSSSTIPTANNNTTSIPNNQGQLLRRTLPDNQSQAPPPLMAQTMQSNTASGITGGSTANNNVTSVVNHNSNMQNVAGVFQDSSRQHGLSSNMFSGSQRQMLGRPHTMSSQQQQQRPQGAQYLYQQQLQQQLLRQNFESGHVPNPNSLSSDMPFIWAASLGSTAQRESANGVDWQEEVFQKIKSLKNAYLPDIEEIYQRAAAKLQQEYSLPQQQRSKQFEKLKKFKTMLERMMQSLSISKSNITPELKDKVAFYEKQIISFLNMHRPRKPVQQGQLPQSLMQPVQQQSSQNGSLAINTVDWRTQHPPASRQKNVNMLLETLKKHVPYSGEEGIEELMRIAVSFEELIFNTAKNQLDYFCKISLKMQSMEEGS